MTADLHKAEIKNEWSCTFLDVFMTWMGTTLPFVSFPLVVFILFSFLCHSVFPYSPFGPSISSLFRCFLLFCMVCVILSFVRPLIIQPSVNLSGTGNLPTDITSPYTSSFRRNERNIIKFVFEIRTMLVSELHWYFGPYRSATGSQRYITFIWNTSSTTQR